MLCHIVKRLQEKAALRRLDPSKIGIQIYEKQDIFGPGFPHSDKYALPFHITNMCASDMGIMKGKPGDFQDWVKINSDKLEKHFSNFCEFSFETQGYRQECNHYPRAIMGEYLKTRFRESVQAAQEAGIAVKLYPSSEVVDLKQQDNRISLTAKDLSSENLFSNDSDRVLLASGHWFEETGQDNYFTSPWPAKKLRRNPACN